MEKSVVKNVPRDKEEGMFFSGAQEGSLMAYRGRPRNGLEGLKQGREEGV